MRAGLTVQMLLRDAPEHTLPEMRKGEASVTLEMMETFLLLAKTCSFSRTAELLFVSQSTITHRIKQLEAELNCALFERNTKTVVITRTGKLFERYAQTIVNLSQESVRELRRYDHFDSNVTIATTDAVWRYYMFLKMKAFIYEHPRTSFRCFTDRSIDTVQRVISGDVDLGAILAQTFHPEIDLLPFFEEEFFLVAAPGIVPEGTVITPDNLDRFPYVHSNWSTDFNSWYDRHYHFRSYQLELEQAAHTIDIVLSGAGVAFLPRSAAVQHLASGEIVRIPYEDDCEPPRYTGYLIYMKRNRDRLAELVEAIRSTGGLES